MYAIVEIGGHQYKVEKDQQLFVNRLNGEKGDKVQFDNVLLIDKGGKVNVGAPVIDGAAVEAKIVDHLRADKVIIFKKKRRKGYKKKNGHRQDITSVEIAKIIETGAKKSSSSKAKAAPKKAAPKKETPKKEAPKAAAAPAAKASGKDDLKKIEGIGPKCAEHLNNGGINTFAELADAKVERVQEILDAAGPRYKIINPSTWAEQAALARDGKWDDLKVLQDQIEGGVKK